MVSSVAVSLCPPYLPLRREHLAGHNTYHFRPRSSMVVWAVHVMIVFKHQLVTTSKRGPIMTWLNNYVRWDFIVMLCLIGALAVFEFVGIFNRPFLTITELTCHYIPAWLRAMIIGWIGYHFLIQYK